MHRRALAAGARAVPAASVRRRSRLGTLRGFASTPPPSQASLGLGRGPIGWASLLAVGGVAGGALYYYSAEKQRRLAEAKKKNNRVTGKALLGGQWTLVDQEGRPVTDASLRTGTHTHALLYFGFTYCPDICPAECIKMKEIIERLDAKVGERVLPVFISVDPKRDGVAQMEHYVKDFHPRTLGLTGTPGQIAQICKAFRVYHSIADQDLEDEDDYLVDHSIVMYLVGPDGKFLDFYTQMTEAEEAVDRILPYLDQDQDHDPDDE